MQRAATEVMEGIIFSAVIDALGSLKSASQGLPNNLLREVQSVHPNTTFADLPRELQESIRLSVRSAFSQLLKEGYSVSASNAPSPPRPPARHAVAERRGPGPDRRPRRPGGPPSGPDGKGPGRGPGAGPRRPRPPKGKPRMS